MLILKRDTAREFIEHLIDKHRPDIVMAYLFGSFARGDYTPTSDIDLLLIGRERGTKRKITADIEEFYAETAIPVSLIYLTEKQFRLLKSSQLISTIMREGEKLHG